MEPLGLGNQSGGDQLLVVTLCYWANAIVVLTCNKSLKAWLLSKYLKLKLLYHVVNTVLEFQDISWICSNFTNLNFLKNHIYSRYYKKQDSNPTIDKLQLDLEMLERYRSDSDTSSVGSAVGSPVSSPKGPSPLVNSIHSINT